MRVILVFLLLLLSRASSFPHNRSVCPTDLSYNLSNCFTYFNYRMNWAQAQHMCQQHGLHLITIQNFNDSSAIAALVKSYQQEENIWIKLEKPSQNTQWKLIHEPGNRQHKTLKGEEVIVKKEVCVELVATEGFLKWNNTDCQERRPFFCQTLPYHSEFWMKGSKVTKLNKVIQTSEQNMVYNLTKYDVEIEKNATKEREKIKESLFTNNHSSEKSLTPFLIISLVFISFLISFFPQIKCSKQDLQT